MFQILAKFGGGQFDPPPRDFGRKGPEWPPNGSNGRKTSYFDE